MCRSSGIAPAGWRYEIFISDELSSGKVSFRCVTVICHFTDAEFVRIQKLNRKCTEKVPVYVPDIMTTNAFPVVRSNIPLLWTIRKRSMEMAASVVMETMPEFKGKCHPKNKNGTVFQWCRDWTENHVRYFAIRKATSFSWVIRLYWDVDRRCEGLQTDYTCLNVLFSCLILNGLY